MALPFNKSIRNRLILIIFTVSAASVLVGFIAIGYLDIRNLNKDLHMDAALHARFIGQNCVGALDFGDAPGALMLLRNLRTVPYIRAVDLYNARDTLFASYRADGETVAAPPWLPQAAPRDGGYHIIEPIIFNKDKIGSIHLKASTFELNQRIRDYIWTLSGLLGLTLALALTLAGRTQRVISGPILSLARVTRRISDKADYAVRVQSPSEDEIGTLYHGFNVMLDQLQKRQNERDLAENALRESEERFRNLVETSSDWIWEINGQWQYTYASPKVRDLLGYEPEELIGKTPFDLMVTDDAKNLLQLFETKAQANLPLEGLQNRNRHADGHIVVLETNATPLRDQDGRLIGYRGVDRDVTDRQRAEEALRQSETKYRTLFTSIADPIIIFDRDDYRILDCNQPTLDRYGYTMAQLKAMTPLDLHPEADRERIRMVINDHSVLNEYHHITQSGEMLDVEIFSTPLEYQGHNALISIIRDISDRKRAEEEIRRTKNYLDNILNSMPSILVGVDKEGRITQWNHEARRQTGLAAESVIGRPLDAAIPELKKEMDHIFKALESRKIMKETRQSRLIGDASRYADLTVYPLITNGVDGAVIRIDDVTDRIRIEEMMIQSEKMLSVGGLAAGMAHEINNPLAGILQNIQVIQNRLFGDLPKNYQVAQSLNLSFEAIKGYMTERNIEAMIETIMASGQRAAKIVDNMLSFSRKSDSRHLAQNLATLMDQTLELAENDYDLKKKYDFRRIRITRDYEADMPKVHCEPSKIQQVLLNILKNGAQAMALGTIKDAPAEFQIKIHRHHDMARIEVADNGPGMDEPIRRRVFEPFFTTKAVGVGTGLGLSVSYFIITENHRGQLSVESKPGQGSRFIIELPIR